MVAHQTKGVLSELEARDSTGQSKPNAGGKAHEPGEAGKIQTKDSILVNKRAQALYAAREEESQFDGLLRKNRDASLQGRLQTARAGQGETPSGDALGQNQTSLLLGAGGSAAGPGKAAGVTSAGMLSQGPRK